MKNIILLDCTLRDGGYVNNWNFGAEEIDFIVKKLTESKIDLIELGYFTKTRKTTNDTTLYDDLEKLDKKLNNKNNIVMINYGEADIDDIPAYSKIKNIYAIRVAFHKEKLDEAINFCKELKEKGWRVFAQPMVTMLYSNNELKKLVEKVNNLLPEALYIVDSFGTMREKDVKSKYEIIDKYLEPSISLGFHSHNNLQLSYSNVISFIELGQKRKIYIDSSVYGMGRGTGNLNTELIIEYLNNYHKNYKEGPILEIIDECLKKEKEKKEWGYSIEYYLSATYDCHPNYARFLIDLHTINISDINEILKSIPNNKKGKFDEAYVKELYTALLNHNVKDLDDYKKINKLLKNKKVILLGSGKSVKTQKSKINKEITENTIIVSLNHLSDIFNTDYTFISNKRRFHEIENKTTNSKVMCTSNVVEKTDKVKIVFDYLNNLAKEYEINDNVLLIFLNILKKAEIKEVFLAGFDGYDAGGNNYYIDRLSFNIINERADRINREIKKYLNLYSKNIKINWITKSKYEGEIK